MRRQNKLHKKKILSYNNSPKYRIIFAIIFQYFIKTDFKE